MTNFNNNTNSIQELLPKGSWRSYISIDEYRTKDGRAYFEYGFARVGNHIQIDILKMPDYGYRDSDQHVTHRLRNPNGVYYICFGDASIIQNLNTAKTWAAQWSELT
ncbi:MAG: hypothetical protein IPL20_03080 [Saprospiraceae bacterium]|nr:hypothetical protein [Saprospiraceae bacterium]